MIISIMKTKVSKEDKAIIELETLLTEKMIEIREKKEENFDK